LIFRKQRTHIEVTGRGGHDGRAEEEEDTVEHEAVLSPNLVGNGSSEDRAGKTAVSLQLKYKPARHLPTGLQDRDDVSLLVGEGLGLETNKAKVSHEGRQGDQATSQSLLVSGMSLVLG